MEQDISTKFVMAELAALSDNANDPTVVEKSAGDIIVEAGEKGSFMFVIERGVAQIMSGEHLLEEASDGDIIGEMALIGNAPRSANILAKTHCRLIPVSKWRFLHLVRKDPEFSLLVMRVMNRRLKKMNERLGTSA